MSTTSASLAKPFIENVKLEASNGRPTLPPHLSTGKHLFVAKTPSHVKDVVTADGLQRIFMLCGYLSLDEYSCDGQKPHVVCSVNR